LRYRPSFFRRRKPNVNSYPPHPQRRSKSKERFAPDCTFREFLSENAEHGIINKLGWATAPGTTYEATVQDSCNDTFYNAVSYISLPDNRVVRYLEDIYDASWLCMTCQGEGTQITRQGG
jgi:hypothetical protein